MDILQEISNKIEKLVAALDGILTKTTELACQGNFVFALEEMIDERFSLFINYSNGQLMLVDKNRGDFDVKELYNVKVFSKEIAEKIFADYIIYSALA